MGGFHSKIFPIEFQKDSRLNCKINYSEKIHSALFIITFFQRIKKINLPNKTISDTASLRKKDFPQKYKSAIIFAPARLFSHLDHFATLSRRFAGIHPYYAFNLAIFFSFLSFISSVWPPSTKD